MLKDVFQVYLNRLIDLSSRNRAIFLPKLITSQMVDLKDFHFLNNHPSFFYITELLGRKRNIPLIPFADARDKAVNQLSQRLKRLQRHIQLTEQETGERSLFVGWPFVEGKLVNDQVVRCPLVFFPVSLVKEDNSWFLRKRTGDQPILNAAFLLSYVHAMGIKLDKNWLQTSLEDFPREPTEFRTALYHFLNQELVLNFTRDLLEDKLDVFEETSRKEEELKQKSGILKLRPFAVLGQFSQKSSFLIEDYEQLKENEHESLEEFLSEWFLGENKQRPFPGEESLFHTFPLDASQEEVMRAVRAGETLVGDRHERLDRRGVRGVLDVRRRRVGPVEHLGEVLRPADHLAGLVRPEAEPVGGRPVVVVLTGIGLGGEGLGGRESTILRQQVLQPLGGLVSTRARVVSHHSPPDDVVRASPVPPYGRDHIGTHRMYPRTGGRGERGRPAHLPALPLRERARAGTLPRIRDRCH